MTSLVGWWRLESRADYGSIGLGTAAAAAALASTWQRAGTGAAAAHCVSHFNEVIGDYWLANAVVS